MSSKIGIRMPVDFQWAIILIINGPIDNLKDNAILTPSLNPSRPGREAEPLPLDGGGRVGVKYDR
jgi:hypothetical protein